MTGSRPEHHRKKIIHDLCRNSPVDSGQARLMAHPGPHKPTLADGRIMFGVHPSGCRVCLTPLWPMNARRDTLKALAYGRGHHTDRQSPCCLANDLGYGDFVPAADPAGNRGHHSVPLFALLVSRGMSLAQLTQIVQLLATGIGDLIPFKIRKCTILSPSPPRLISRQRARQYFLLHDTHDALESPLRGWCRK